MSIATENLDQAVDRLAFLTDATAEEYERYLRGEYMTNMQERWAGWEPHYQKMREAFRDCLMSVLEERGATRGSMNVAIIGPGFDPIGRDFGKDDIGPIFRRLQSIVLTDISQAVCLSARDAFIGEEIPGQKIHMMQYDITNGLSTVFKRFVEERLAMVTTEEQLSDATEELGKLQVEDLDSRLLSDLDKIPPRRRASLLDGGENTARTWQLSVEGELLPLDLVSYQMVLAGTLAHVMQIFRDRFVEVTSATQPKSIDRATEQARLGMLERLHKFVAKFNTQIAVRSIRKVLGDNPEATVLGITDVSTVYDKPRFGELPELNIDELKQELAFPADHLRTENVPPIVTRVLDSWSWHDEPEHHHRVIHMEFEVGFPQPDRNGAQRGNESATSSSAAKSAA